MYQCDRCGYQSKRKYNVQLHLNKKKVCKPLLSDIEIEILREKYTKFYTEIKCKWCQMSFKHKPAKYVHQKSCALRNEDQVQIQALQKKVKEMENKYNEMKLCLIQPKVQTQQIQTQNNTQNTNTQNNITVNAFINTDTSYIPQDLIKSCLLTRNLTPLFEKMFCDPAHPENHNLKIKNQRHETLAIFDGLGWNAGEKNEITKQIINKFGFKILLKFYVENFEDQFGAYTIEYPNKTQLFRIETGDDLDEDMRVIKAWLEDLESINYRRYLLDQISTDVFTLLLNNKLYVCRKI
jgi:hypothetical protein